MPHVNAARRPEGSTADVYEELGAYFQRRCEERPSPPRNRIRLEQFRNRQPVTVEDWLIPKWARPGKVRNVRVRVYPDGALVEPGT